ncbi:BspA family leucine-rich repeat surface protein [Lactiplantibacillus pentosus]|uniref:BspA family leucine-rich repeat surface protein n=1 Tax=Lactiplantibacillus pentosus TaxID=1589 RepID=UPI0024412882|nr:BspA family leucine-rich repeat surface protein [Lactiplantibacillus pentosus]
MTAEADNRAKSVSTTPYTDGDNAVENKQNTTTVTTSADKSATRSQSTTETGTTPAQSVETDKAGSAGDSVPVDSATKADQVNDTSLSNDGYDAVGTDVNSSQPSETDKTGTDQTQSSTDGIDSQTVTDEKTSAGLTADSLSSLQPRLAQVQASSLQLDTVDAAPTVAQDYAAWDAITDTTRKGIMGTSEWWIDDSDNTLHLGAGQLADANVQFDDNTEVTDWGNVGWGQYMDKHTSLTLVLEGNLKLGTNARGLFSGLTVKTESLKSDISNSVWNRVDVSKTRDMSYMFARATTVAVDYNANYASGYFYFENWSLYEVNVAHMFERVSSRSDSAHPTVTDTSFRVSLPGYSTYTDMSYMFNSSDLAVMIFGTASVMDPNKSTSMSHIFNDCKNLTGLGLERLDTESVIDMSYMFNNDINLTGVNMRDWVTDRTRFSTINVTNMSHMFTNCNSMKDLDVSLFKTSSVTNMSHMFTNCNSMKDLDVSLFKTSSVTNMSHMFTNCNSMKDLDVSLFKTSSVTNMSHMFTNCNSMKDLDVSLFKTSSVTNMSHMFTNCNSMKDLDVSLFKTSSVTNMSHMFTNCNSMKDLDVSLFKTSSVTNMSHMFTNCNSMKDLDVSLFKTSSVTNMSHMFTNCNSMKDLDVSLFKTSSVTNMSHMFTNCNSMKDLDVSLFKTSSVTNMSHMFTNCNSMKDLDVSLFKTSSVTNMSHMFTNCNSMKDLDVSLFKTSSVTNMSHMFDGCHSQTLDVAGFDTAQVADMTAMFNNATKVERLDLSNFDTHLISNMTNMFSQCESLTSLILPINFVTKKVTTMHQMFKNCWALTSLVLPNGFDTSNVTDMDELFSGCKSLISLDLSKLDTSRIVNMSAFFNDCQSLKTLKLSNFTTDLVTTMAEMFNGCQSLVTLDLSMFDTGNVTTMAEMFNGCQSLVTLDLSVFDTGRVTTMARMFNDCSSMETLAFSFNAQNVITTFEMFAGCSSLANFNSASLMNTGNVTNMSGMFKGDRALVSLDISKLATSQVTTMSHMFEDVFAAQKVQSFTGLEKLDTSNVTDMSYMFAGFFLPVAMSLNLVNFDTRKVLNMQGMFKGYVNFKDNYLGYLQTGNVTDMSYMLSGLVNHTQFTWSNNLDTHSVTTMAYMFSDSPDMETFVWKQQLGMNRVTDMQGMFANNIALVNVDFEQFDSSQVTNMQGMFANNIALVNVDFEQFDSSQVTNMQGMFANNIALVNVNFEQFDTSQVTDMTSMFSGDTRLERLDLTSFDTSNVEHMYKMFYLDSALKNLNLSSFSGEKLQFNYVMGWGLFGLFNPPIVWDSDGNQQVGQYQTCPSTLTLGGKTRLSLPKLTSVVDLFDPSQLTEEVIQALLETYPTVEAFNEALVAETGLTTDLLVSAYLAPSQGFDGVWINNATAETLTSEQLMARYDGTNPLATDATWTWQNILGKDLQVISGTNSTWAPKDSLAGLIDTSKTVDDLTTTVTDTTTNQTLTSSQLNALLQQPAHSGQYQVAYQYTDGDGTKQISVPVTLSLVANQSLITAKDSVLQLGTTWTAADNIASLLDADGSVTDLTNVNGVVSVNGIENGTVDTTIPGVYQIDYQITDSTGTVRTATATVIVNGLTLKETQVNVSTDDRWDPMTNITKAIDDQGNEATVELTIMDASDTEVANIKKPGTYQLNYHFTDAHGEHTATAAVNVKADENHADLQVKDSRVYQFGTWTPTDNFVSAMDSDGETLDISALSVTGTVDLNLVGKYTITYQFTDQFGVAHSGQATVEVLENQAAISVDNNSGKLYAHGVWNPDSVVVTATDVDGTTVEAKKIKCSGTVDMTTPGENKLTYSFVDSLGKEHSKDTTVTVLENQAAINVDNNSGTLYANGIWNPESVVVNATDVDGTVVEGSEIKRSGTVDMTTPGEYELTYSFVDSLGKEHSKNTTVTVLENQAAISVDNNSGTLYANGIWNPDSIVITAIDVDGTTVENTKIKCSGTVDVTTPGEYKLTYSFVDSLGKEHSKDTTVTVLENHAAINVDNNRGTLYANGIWNPDSIVLTAIDVDDTTVENTKIKCSGTVDVTTPGEY